MKKLLIFLSLIIGLYSCSGVEQSTPATLHVLLEDSPVDYQEVNVIIDHIAIFNGTQWYELASPVLPIDILRLVGGNSEKVVEQNIPVGEYSQIRFTFLSENNTVKVNNQVHKLTISESDREVVMPIKLNFNSENQYLICDIDAAASINEDGWVFKPKLKMINLNEAGIISGILSAEDGKSIAQRMLVDVTSADGVSRFTYTNADNGRVFMRIDEGVYTVSIFPNSTSTYNKIVIKDVVVKKAEATKLGTIIMQINKLNEPK